MQRSRRVMLSLSALFAVTFAVAGCSATGGRLNAERNAQVVGAAPKFMTVAFISHAAPGDTFWDVVRKGAEDAAVKDGVVLEYTSDPNGANQANLIRQAIDKKVDGIAVTLAKPDALSAQVKAAREAGISVVGLNGGQEAWKSVGALSFFGQDDRVAGKAAGERLVAEGAQKALCVVHEQGNVGHEARCAGVADAFPATEKLYVDGTDMADVQTKITAKLQEDPSVTHVVALGAPFAITASKAVQDAGSSAATVTFDLSKEAVRHIRDGSIRWAVDQQPYLQGYLAVDALWLNKTNGNVTGGGQPVFTGPAFVDAKNIDAVSRYVEAGKR
ncbi:sugar ABC transporter substrate-binding protein [Dermatophilus congolensis]|uniref:sugar ABC transporter substrate-binding protein n=1 Tax=Dermatophilus congolensis TaxID=1863 RepID=UPI003C7B60FF